MFASVVAPEPWMSPTEQSYLAQKIDEMAMETNRRFDKLHEQQKEDRHALRNDMQLGFGKTQAEVAELRRELTGADRRLLIVETERKSEQNAAVRRAGWVSLAIGLGWSVLQFLFGWLDKRG